MTDIGLVPTTSSATTENYWFQKLKSLESEYHLKDSSDAVANLASIKKAKWIKKEVNSYGLYHCLKFFDNGQPRAEFYIDNEAKIQGEYKIYTKQEIGFHNNQTQTEKFYVCKSLFALLNFKDSFAHGQATVYNYPQPIIYEGNPTDLQKDGWKQVMNGNISYNVKIFNWDMGLETGPFKIISRKYQEQGEATSLYKSGQTDNGRITGLYRVYVNGILTQQTYFNKTQRKATQSSKKEHGKNIQKPENVACWSKDLYEMANYGSIVIKRSKNGGQSSFEDFKKGSIVAKVEFNKLGQCVSEMRENLHLMYKMSNSLNDKNLYNKYLRYIFSKVQTLYSNNICYAEGKYLNEKGMCLFEGTFGMSGSRGLGPTGGKFYTYHNLDEDSHTLASIARIVNGHSRSLVKFYSPQGKLTSIGSGKVSTRNNEFCFEKELPNYNDKVSLNYDNKGCFEVLGLTTKLIADKRHLDKKVFSVQGYVEKAGLFYQGKLNDSNGMVTEYNIETQEKSLDFGKYLNGKKEGHHLLFTTDQNGLTKLEVEFYVKNDKKPLSEAEKPKEKKKSKKVVSPQTLEEQEKQKLLEKKKELMSKYSKNNKLQKSSRRIEKEKIQEKFSKEEKAKLSKEAEVKRKNELETLKAIKKAQNDLPEVCTWFNDQNFKEKLLSESKTNEPEKCENDMNDSKAAENTQKNKKAIDKKDKPKEKPTKQEKPAPKKDEKTPTSKTNKSDKPADQIKKTTKGKPETTTTNTKKEKTEKMPETKPKTDNKASVPSELIFDRDTDTKNDKKDDLKEVKSTEVEANYINHLQGIIHENQQIIENIKESCFNEQSKSEDTELKPENIFNSLEQIEDTQETSGNLQDLSTSQQKTESELQKPQETEVKIESKTNEPQTIDYFTDHVVHKKSFWQKKKKESKDVVSENANAIEPVQDTNTSPQQEKITEKTPEIRTSTDLANKKPNEVKQSKPGTKKNTKPIFEENLIKETERSYNKPRERKSFKEMRLSEKPKETKVIKERPSVIKERPSVIKERPSVVNNAVNEAQNTAKQPKKEPVKDKYNSRVGGWNSFSKKVESKYESVYTVRGGIPNKIFKDAQIEDSKAWKHSNKIEDDEYVSEYALHEPNESEHPKIKNQSDFNPSAEEKKLEKDTNKNASSTDLSLISENIIVEDQSPVQDKFNKTCEDLTENQKAKIENTIGQNEHKKAVEEMKKKMKKKINNGSKDITGMKETQDFTKRKESQNVDARKEALNKKKPTEINSLTNSQIEANRKGTSSLKNSKLISSNTSTEKNNSRRNLPQKNLDTTKSTSQQKKLNEHLNLGSRLENSSEFNKKTRATSNKNISDLKQDKSHLSFIEEIKNNRLSDKNIPSERNSTRSRDVKKITTPKAKIVKPQQPIVEVKTNIVTASKKKSKAQKPEEKQLQIERLSTPKTVNSKSAQKTQPEDSSKKETKLVSDSKDVIKTDSMTSPDQKSNDPTMRLEPVILRPKSYNPTPAKEQQNTESSNKNIDTSNVKPDQNPELKETQFVDDAENKEVSNFIQALDKNSQNVENTGINENTQPKDLLGIIKPNSDLVQSEVIEEPTEEFIEEPREEVGIEKQENDELQIPTLSQIDLTPGKDTETEQMANEIMNKINNPEQFKKPKETEEPRHFEPEQKLEDLNITPAKDTKTEDIANKINEKLNNTDKKEIQDETPENLQEKVETEVTKENIEDKSLENVQMTPSSENVQKAEDGIDTENNKNDTIKTPQKDLQTQDLEEQGDSIKVDEQKKDSDTEDQNKDHTRDHHNYSSEPKYKIDHLEIMVEEEHLRTPSNKEPLELIQESPFEESMLESQIQRQTEEVAKDPQDIQSNTNQLQHPTQDSPEFKADYLTVTEDLNKTENLTEDPNKTENLTEDPNKTENLTEDPNKTEDLSPGLNKKGNTTEDLHDKERDLNLSVDLEKKYQNSQKAADEDGSKWVSIGSIVHEEEKEHMRKSNKKLLSNSKRTKSLMDSNDPQIAELFTKYGMDPTKLKSKQQSPEVIQDVQEKYTLDELKVSNFSIEPKLITESQISDLNNNGPDSLLNSEIMDNKEEVEEEQDEAENMRQLSYKKKQRIDNILRMKKSFDSSKKANKSQRNSSAQVEVESPASINQTPLTYTERVQNNENGKKPEIQVKQFDLENTQDKVEKNQQELTSDCKTDNKNSPEKNNSSCAKLKKKNNRENLRSDQELTITSQGEIQTQTDKQTSEFDPNIVTTSETVDGQSSSKTDGIDPNLMETPKRSIKSSEPLVSIERLEIDKNNIDTNDPIVENIKEEDESENYTINENLSKDNKPPEINDTKSTIQNSSPNQDREINETKSTIQQASPERDNKSESMNNTNNNEDVIITDAKITSDTNKYIMQVNVSHSHKSSIDFREESPLKNIAISETLNKKEENEPNQNSSKKEENEPNQNSHKKKKNNKKKRR